METRLVQFREKPLEMLFLDDRHCFTAETIGTALEYSEPAIRIAEILRRNKEEFEEGIDYLITQFALSGQRREMLVFFQTGVNLLGMFSKQPLAKEFRRWAKQVLAAVQQAAPPPGPEEFREQYLSLAREHITLQSRYISRLEGELEARDRRIKRASPKPVSAEEETEIIRLFRTHQLTQTQIARQVGRSSAVVSFILRREKQQGGEQ